MYMWTVVHMWALDMWVRGMHMKALVVCTCGYSAHVNTGVHGVQCTFGVHTLCAL